MVRQDVVAGGSSPRASSPSIPGEKATDSVDYDKRTISPEPLSRRSETSRAIRRQGLIPAVIPLTSRSQARAPLQQQAELGGLRSATTAERHGQTIASLVSSLVPASPRPFPSKERGQRSKERGQRELSLRHGTRGAATCRSSAAVFASRPNSATYLIESIIEDPRRAVGSFSGQITKSAVNAATF
jgi:hypothetical protein